MKSIFYQGDCLIEMNKIEDKSVDLILCDLPYGVTDCKWDTIIPFDKLWEQYNRIIKNNGAIVLTATNPFSSAVVASNFKGFKYEWIWEKEQGVGFQLAKYRPMQKHEHVLIFTKDGEKVIYYPIKIKLDKPKMISYSSVTSDSSPMTSHKVFDRIYFDKHPTSVLKISRDNKNRIHPTQKPVALLEYLIKTYTIEGETVLDNCMGSGSTGVACKNTNRNFIGIEKEEKYFNMAVERIEKTNVVEEQVKETSLWD